MTNKKDENVQTSQAVQLVSLLDLLILHFFVNFEKK